MSKAAKARQQTDEWIDLMMFCYRNRSSPEFGARAEAFKRKWGTCGPKQPMTEKEKKKAQEEQDRAIAAELAKGKSVSLVRSIGPGTVAIIEMKQPSNRAVDPKKPAEKREVVEVKEDEEDA